MFFFHHFCFVLQLCAERTGVSETAVWGQNHPAEVSGEEMSTFQEPCSCLRVSAVHVAGDKPTPLLCCHTGKYKHTTQQTDFYIVCAKERLCVKA